MNIPPPSSGCVVFSTFLRLTFDGPCNYLKDLLARITTPSLEFMHTRLFEQPEPRFRVSQLSQFLGRVELQSLPDGVEVRSGASGLYLSFTRSVALPGGRPKTLECLRLDHSAWSCLELPLMTQICQQISPFLSNVRTLGIMLSLLDEKQSTRWIAFLCAFDHVEKLHFSEGPSVAVACTLQSVSPEMAADVLPTLRELRFDSVTSESWVAVTSFIDLPSVTVVLHGPEVNE
ncbi:hypothetical protein EDB84DRAFT_1578412 [Lactarius hengduanensis]|nr:hypothetical protein EDB84DRAFT_1578412 [Lactarius hengduanensis]